MTMLYDTKHPGASAHALIVAVEASGSGAEPFSPVASAMDIVRGWTGIAINGAPVSTIELIASPPVRPESMAPHFDLKTQRPTRNVFESAAYAWIKRLQQHDGNVGLFYYVGPTLEVGEEKALALDPGMGTASPSDRVHLGNFWSGLIDQVDGTKLLFIDGCPAKKVDGVLAPASQMFELSASTDLTPANRSFFAYNRKPLESSQLGPGTPTIFSAALSAVLQPGQGMTASQLGAKLKGRLGFLLQQQRLTSPEPLQIAHHGDLLIEIDRATTSSYSQPPPPPPPPPPSPTEITNVSPQQQAAGAGEKEDSLARKKAGPRRKGQWTKIDKDGAMEAASGPGEDRIEPQAKSPFTGSSKGPRQESVSDTYEENARANMESASLRNPDVDEPEPAATGPQVPEPGVAEPRVVLTQREFECLLLVDQGKTTKEIARELRLSPHTINSYVRTATSKFGETSRQVAAARLAEIVAADAASHAELVGTESQSTTSEPESESSDSNTHFVDDDPEVDRDDLGRGPLAIVLARRLHRIWCRSNGVRVPGEAEEESEASGAGRASSVPRLDALWGGVKTTFANLRARVLNPFPAGGAERAAFVLHLDAPWGGGKTTFANFLARVLNPFPAGAERPARFLLEAINVPIDLIKEPQPLGTIFIDDPRPAKKDDPEPWHADARRPWIIVPFNAWRAEHCAPPWWVFYQAIRKGCLKAILAEGTAAVEPGATRAAEPPCLAERFWIRAEFLWREFWWRLRNPKVVTRLATFAITAVVLLVLWQSEIIFRGEGGGPELNAGNALGFLLIGIGGISGLWGVGALLTESMAPGLDDAAERRSLGSNDPLERFRRHFARTIAASKRPVMVIIDDLDRCRPDFVVDLVRGIQTLLRSPRIVFVILGDRAWIERAFEAHHEAMKMINVGPEQSFGARFVQKAIQMSFILPEIPDDKQQSYVRRVLIGNDAAAAGQSAPPAPAEVSQMARDDYRQGAAAAKSPEALQEVEKRVLEETAKRLLEACPPAQTAPPEAEAGPAGGETDASAATAAQPALTEEEAQAQAAKIMDKERALLAAVDDKIGRDLLHRFEPLAPFFPANPRQIKRIANAIGMYVCASYMHFGWKPQDERIFELAIWITLMTEWPDTWRSLAWWPELADHLTSDPPATAGEGGTDPALATLEREAARIRTEPMLFALITGKAAGRDGKIPARARLRTDSVRYFVELTPLYSGNARPAAEESRSAPA